MRFLVIGVILILSGAYSVYTITQQEKTIFSDISGRSVEYIKDKKNQYDETWMNVDFYRKSSSSLVQTSQKNTIKNDCLSFIVPFSIKEIQKIPHCSFIISLNISGGRVLVLMRSGGFSTFEDVPDIKIRQQNTDRYKGEVITIGGYPYMIFKVVDSLTYEKSAFTFVKGKLVSFTLIVPTNENLDIKFDELLSSISYK